MSADERSAAFDALRAHPDLARWLAHDPDARDARRGCRDLGVLALVVALGGAATLASLAFLPQLAFVPLALLGVGALAGLSALVRRRPARGALVRFPARVLALDARVADRPGASGESRYTVRLEDEAGRQHALDAAPAGLGALAVGALGIAFARGGELELFVTLRRPAPDAAR